MAKERELPEVLEIPFVICDNSVNRYSWRLLVGGIDLKGFKMNPVCCYQHDTYSVAVGRWKDLKIVGEELHGIVEFDRNDEESVKLYWKYKDGFMSAVSLNIITLETSEDKKLLLPGQKYPSHWNNPALYSSTSINSLSPSIQQLATNASLNFNSDLPLDILQASSTIKEGELK